MVLPLDRLDVAGATRSDNPADRPDQRIPASLEHHDRTRKHSHPRPPKNTHIHENQHPFSANPPRLPIEAIEAAVAVRRARAAVISSLGWIAVVIAGAGAKASAAESEGLRVEVEVARGVHHVGQGFELGVAVVGAGRRPEVDPPTVAGADVWMIRNNEIRPISVSGIGGVVGESNVFVSRFRVVPRRAGTLEIPSIRAHLGDETGRSRPLRVTIQPVPAEGRPAEFLGGVGRFTLGAEAIPRAVRVGQELEYRITVSGPSAWGMTARPDLGRFDRLDLGLRIEPKAVELTREPPSRTFSYTIRPTRPGEAVLPPVAIAAFDPSSRHYLTRVTPGVPIRVVAVPAFDPATIPDLGPSADGEERRRTGIQRGALIVAAALLTGAALAIAWARRRARLAGRLGGPVAARRFAARVARDLARQTTTDDPALALVVIDGLIGYLRRGIGRPPGALTPDEASAGIARCKGSEELGAEAARITARCDALLYRDAPTPPEDPGRLRDDARAFFDRLGSRS